MNKRCVLFFLGIMPYILLPDYIVRHLPEDSLVRQRHTTERHGTGWFGFDSTIRKECDKLNRDLEFFVERREDPYSVQDCLKKIFLDDLDNVEQEAVSFYKVSENSHEAVKKILADQPEWVQLAEQQKIVDVIALLAGYGRSDADKELSVRLTDD